MTYDGAGSLFALGLRLTKLDATGTPLTGAGNVYTTESLVSINFGLAYSEPNAVEFKNGQGITCVYYTPPRTLLNGTLDELKVCTPDPYITEFLIGGEVITTGGTNEVQTVTITGTPTGGTFTLTYDGETTSPLAYNAAASAVQAALLALDNISTGQVTVSGGPGPDTPYVVTFAGSAGSSNVPQMTATGGFTGGSTPAVAVTTTTGGVAGATAIGYRAPEVNKDPTPNGVAIEAWSRAVRDNAFDATYPYWHWVVGRAKLAPSDALALGAEDPSTPSFTGTCDQNANFGDGPASDIEFPTDRVWQYCRVADIPTLTDGLAAVS
jgi:hypothetical protein